MALTLANLRIRTLAFLLDFVLIALYIGVLIIVGVTLGFGLFSGVFLSLFAYPTSSEITVFLLFVVPVLLYFALLECSPWQAIWGKRKWG